MTATERDFEIAASQIQTATEVFAYKWHPVILYVIYELDGASYSEIDATLDEISSKMLSNGLSDLCERNILTTAETVEDSGKTVYELTDKGHALVPCLQILGAWSKRYDENRPSVLIVEDERMVAEMLSGFFSESYDVQHVRNGEEALEEYTDDTELLILDRKLERMSGDAVATQIKAQDEQTLILAVSGLAPDNDIFELDVDDYIHKPAEESEIKSRLELLLNRAELDATERTYLSLRSKQIALTETHGRAATEMNAYQNCTARIEELGLSSERRQTLEPLLPSTASDSSPFRE